MGRPRSQWAVNISILRYEGTRKEQSGHRVKWEKMFVEALGSRARRDQRASNFW